MVLHFLHTREYDTRSYKLVKPMGEKIFGLASLRRTSFESRREFVSYYHTLHQRAEVFPAPVVRVILMPLGVSRF